MRGVRYRVGGRAVGGAADLLNVSDVLVGPDVLAALEEHVLEQVGEAGAAGSLVLRADVVPEVDGDQRHRRVAMEHDPQPVVQGVAFKSQVRHYGKVSMSS